MSREVRTAWLWGWGAEGELRSVVGGTAASSAFSALDTLRLARSMRLRLRLRPCLHGSAQLILLAYLLILRRANEKNTLLKNNFGHLQYGGIIQPTFLFPFFVI